jgi:hypothetical protein
LSKILITKHTINTSCKGINHCHCCESVYTYLNVNSLFATYAVRTATNILLETVFKTTPLYF